jgi:suppressor of ftsI
VTRGLAGLFYLDDGTNPNLPHRYGIDDIPVILQDRSFD